MTAHASGPGSAGGDDHWERLSAAFVAVLARPDAERDTAVSELSGSDPAFRAELESLLAAHHGAPAFLDSLYVDVIQPALQRGTPAVHGPNDPTRVEATIAAGTSIRHFVVQERIASGGGGVVYRGRDTLLERDVAIKVLLPQHRDDAEARTRLIREARAASQLDDPHVCPIHAIEPLDDGSLCLVMGFCGGGTLRDRLRQGPVPTAALLPLARAIASGLASAHRTGIVHGDIKPANIGFGEQDVPRLLDFGIAVSVQAGAHDPQHGFGTLPYLAPELWRGAPRSPQSDVWALGVTLAEVVLGRRPFDAPTREALAAQIAAAHLPILVRPDGTPAPPALTRAIAAMLHTNPAARPADGAAVLAVLDAPTPVPPALAPRASAPRTRRVAFTVMLGAITATTGVVLARRRPADRPTATPAVEVAPVTAPAPTLAVLPFTTRGPASVSYLANGLVDLLTPAFDATGLVRGIDPNAVIAASEAQAPDATAARRVAAAVKADRYVVGSLVASGPSLVLRATLHLADGTEVGRATTTARTFGELPTAGDALVRQLIATTLVAPGDTIASVAAATTMSSPALRAYLDGERALRDARPVAAMAHFRSAVAADSTFALAWYRLARAARWSDVDSVRTTAARQAARWANALPVRHQQIIQAHATLHTRSPRELERELQRIVADYPTDVDAWMLLGELQFANNPHVGRPIGESGAAFRRVMALDPRHREVTVYLMDLAAQADQRPQLDTLFTMYFRPNSAGEQPGIRAAYSALHQQYVGDSRRERGWPAPGDDPLLARVAIERSMAGTVDRARATAWATTMATASETRLDGLLALATLATAEGAWPVAAALLDSAAALAPARAAELRATLVLAPAITAAPDAIRAARAMLRAAPLAPDDAAEALSREERAHLRVYLDGLLSTRLGDAEGVAAARATLRAVPSARSRLAAPLLAALDGHVACEQSAWARAVSAFENGVADLPVRIRRRHPALAQGLDRYRRAEAYDRLGRTVDAARWRATLRESSGLADLPFQARRPPGGPPT